MWIDEDRRGLTSERTGTRYNAGGTLGYYVTQISREMQDIKYAITSAHVVEHGKGTTFLPHQAALR